MKIGFLLSVLFLSITVRASQNQAPVYGSAVVCRDSSSRMTSVEMLGLYTGRRVLHLPHVFESTVNNEAFLRRINEVIRGLNSTNYSTKVLEPALALVREFENFRQTGTSANSDFMFVADKLTEDLLFDQIPLPGGCSIERVATKQTRYFPQDPVYIVQKDLLMALDQDGLRNLVLSMALAEPLSEKSADVSGEDFSYYTPLVLSAQLTVMPLEQLNFKAQVETIKTPFVKSIKNYFLGNLSKTESGDFRYTASEGKYIVNASGEIDAAKTRMLGESNLWLSLFGATQDNTLTINKPKNATLTAHLPDGSTKQVSSSSQLGITTRAGVVEIVVHIPTQMGPVGIFGPRIDHYELVLMGESLSVQKTLLRADKHLFAVTMTKKFRVDLDKDLKWNIFEL